MRLACGRSCAGPHATMKLRVKDQVWDVVLAPPARTIAAGLKEGVIPVGATVSVHGHKHRDAKKLEIKSGNLNFLCFTLHEHAHHLRTS